MAILQFQKITDKFIFKKCISMAKEVNSISALSLKSLIQKGKKLQEPIIQILQIKKVGAIKKASKCISKQNAWINYLFAKIMLKKHVVHRINESLTSKPKICNVKDSVPKR